MFARLIHPPPRLANTCPAIPDSLTSAANDSTPNLGDDRMCGSTSLTSVLTSVLPMQRLAGDPAVVYQRASDGHSRRVGEKINV